MKNDFEIRGDVTAIFLKKRDGTILETLISTSDLSKVCEFPNSWYSSTDRNGFTYVLGHTPRNSERKRHTELLHRWIMGDPQGMVIDHINHNTLDNTRDNLRICSQSQNLHNFKGALKCSKSGVRGVWWNKRMERWQAQIRVSGKKIHIGTFKDKLSAAQATLEARNAQKK